MTAHFEKRLALFGFAVCALFTCGAMAQMNTSIKRVESEVSIHNDLLSGKARYMPGAACIIATNQDTTPAQIVNFARACAKSHEIWLQENTKEGQDQGSDL